jgi:hypothetical protein
MGIDKENNKIALEMISHHLDEALRFCNRLDLSRLSSLEQSEWDSRMKTCKNAIEFTMQSVQRLSEILK